MNIKLYGWYFLHNKLKFWSDVRKKLHILPLEKSQYYPACEEFYSKLDVRDKIVIDMGDDFGTTPMYFLRRGAQTVIGFSKDKQYFHSVHYKHYNINVDNFSFSTIISSIKRLQEETAPDAFVLKSDCEGCEWNFTQDFIELFEDWIIGVHTPIENNELYNYIKENGELIGKEEGSEIGIYKKKKVVNE